MPRIYDKKQQVIDFLMASPYSLRLKVKVCPTRAIMKKRITIILSTVALLMPAWAMAWNATGHEVVAQIAYDNLNPKARTEVDKLYPVLGQYFPQIDTFTAIATWPDVIIANGTTAFSAWHYINLPLVIGKVRAPRHPPTENVVWAIGQAQATLTSQQTNVYTNSMFLAFLIHFVGDIHQPLHAVSLYSKQFPKGDRGGTLFPINSSSADNLHEFWDDGLGLYSPTFAPNAKTIRQLASKIEKAYPASYFGNQPQDLSPMDWAHESYVIDKQYVYQIKPNAHPSAKYIAQGQLIAEQRVALAGYRLANVLNQIFV